jgi:hypothetical protein
MLCMGSQSMGGRLSSLSWCLRRHLVYKIHEVSVQNTRRLSVQGTHSAVSGPLGRVGSGRWEGGGWSGMGRRGRGWSGPETGRVSRNT